MASFWRTDDIIIALCVCWVVFCYILVSGKHLKSVMAVPRISSYLIWTILWSLPSHSLTCDTIIGRPSSGHHCQDSRWSESLSAPEPECTLVCMQKSGCIATNYNPSDGTCQLLPAACPQASDDAAMTYIVHGKVDRGQCLEWIDYSLGMPVDERCVLTRVGGDEERRVWARIKSAGEYYPSQLTPPYNECHGTNGARVTLTAHASYFAWKKVVPWHSCQVTGEQVTCFRLVLLQ